MPRKLYISYSNVIVSNIIPPICNACKQRRATTRWTIKNRRTGKVDDAPVLFTCHHKKCNKEIQIILKQRLKSIQFKGILDDELLDELLMQKDLLKNVKKKFNFSARREEVEISSKIDEINKEIQKRTNKKKRRNTYD